MLLNAVAKSSASIAVGANTTVQAATGAYAAGVVVTSITLRAGTTSSSLSLLDGSNGTSQWILSNIAVTAAGDTTVSQSFPSGLVFPNGLYATVVGTGGTAFIAYQPV